MENISACCACLQLCASNTPIDAQLKRRYAVLTRLQLIDELRLCHFCQWLLKKSYAFVEKCRVAHAVLEQCGLSDVGAAIDGDVLKRQDAYQQNEGLFRSKLGISEIINAEYSEIQEMKPEGTVAYVRVEDILKGKTRGNVAASSRSGDQILSPCGNEAIDSEDATAEANCTEFVSLNEGRPSNEIYSEDNNLNGDYGGVDINEFGLNHLEDDLEVDAASEKRLGTSVKVETRFKSAGANERSIERKKKGEKTNYGFESLRLSVEEQRDDLKSRRKDSKYLNSKFRCYNCALGFVHEDSYKMHVARHEESNGKYRCEVCTLRFATRSGFCMHRAVHRQRFRCRLCLEVVKKCQFHRARCRVKMVADATVKCSVCGKVFGDSSGVRRHAARQHAASRGQTFQCQRCDKKFAYAHTLRSHLLLHEATSSHTCRLCDRRFMTHKRLAEHEKSHVEATGSYYCASCDVTLKNAKSLRAHYAKSSKHASPEQYRHSCVSCDATYVDARDLRAHAERHHPTGTAYSCAACGATYACSKTLGDHCRRVHAAARRDPSFVCEFCGKAFKAKSVLRKHIELHSSERAEASNEVLTETDAEKNDRSRTAYSSVSTKELNVMDAL